MEASPGCQPLALLRHIYQTRELSGMLVRLISPLAPGMQLALECPGAVSPLRLPARDDVSHQLAQVVKLVLQDLEHPEFPFASEPTEAGAAALWALQRAVFGGASSRSSSDLAPPPPQPASLMQAVFCGSAAQAAAVQRLCVAVARDALAPHTCLSVYAVAAACRSEGLAAEARAYALRHFSAAARLDYAGLTSLAPASLMGLLCSDALQVGSEYEVFQALVAWTEHAPAARASGFARRLAAAVRLPLLTMPELEAIDSHSLVGKSKQALEVVAHAYLALSTGLPVELPNGFRTCARARHTPAAPAQPPPQQQQEAAACLELAGLGLLGAELLPAAAGAPASPRQPSALVEALRELAAEGCEGVAAADGPGTPAPVTDAPEPVAVHVVAAPTPLMRAPSLPALAPPAAPQQGSRAFDVVPAATRRTLFCASPPPAGACGAGSLLSPRMRSPAGRGRSLQLQVAAGPRASAAKRKISYAEEAPVLAAPLPLAAAQSLQAQMALSPTRAGIHQWLDRAEEELAQQGPWLSKRRLGYE